MIRSLGERVPVPSPAVQGVAVRLEDEARRLAALARGSDDLDLGRLWRRLAMWSATVAHLASSGPASHDVALRGFEEHPDHARAGEDTMIEFEALADAIGFLAVGDMVLSAIAATFLGRWDVTHDDDNPWPAFLTAVDGRARDGGDRGFVGAVRELDLDLREARNRLAAHRRRAHSEILSWDFDDVITIELTNPGLRRIDRALLEELGMVAPGVAEEGDPHPDAAVIQLLEAADRQLEEAAAAHPGRRLPVRRDRAGGGGDSDMRDLFDRLHIHAKWLGAEGRRLVRAAHRIAGYESVSPIRVVGAALRVTGEITGPA